MLVPVEHARAKLEAAKFTPRKDMSNATGEWWQHPSGWPILFMQYRGNRKDNFDNEQLEHVLGQGGPYRNGNTIGH